MIGRVWHAWTTHADADAFEAIVRTEIYPATAARNLPGFRGSQLLRLARAGQTEFVIITWFDDMEAVRRFAGDDYEKPMVTPKARALLRRSDPKPEHYEVREII